MGTLRIAMISGHASPLAELGGPDAGGQNVHVAELARHLARRGHEVRVYTRRDRVAQPPTVTHASGYRVEHVPAGPPRPIGKDEVPPFMPRFGHWLEDLWRSTGFHPDVVHAHFWMSGLAARVALRGSATPYIVTFHGLGTVKRRMLGAADTSPAGRIGLEREVALSAQRVIAQSSNEMLELAAYGIGTGRISLVSSGVDTQAFQPAQARPVPGRILSAGRLLPRKGFGRLVRLLPVLPEAHLVIAGGPPRSELIADPVAGELRELALRLGVQSRLELLGSVPQQEMPALYRSARVLACVPDYEPFGLTPLEAMACGTPVVAHAVGGLSDTVRHRRTGELLRLGDQRGLADALRRLLSEEDTRRGYGAEAVRHVRKTYPWTRIAEMVESTYRVALAESALEPARLAGATPTP
jgi:D-inositol-3-phosphate glycosyltransferase